MSTPSQSNQMLWSPYLRKIVNYLESRMTELTRTLLAWAVLGIATFLQSFGSATSPSYIFKYVSSAKNCNIYVVSGVTMKKGIKSPKFYSQIIREIPVSEDELILSSETIPSSSSAPSVKSAMLLTLLKTSKPVALFHLLRKTSLTSWLRAPGWPNWQTTLKTLMCDSRKYPYLPKGGSLQIRRRSSKVKMTQQGPQSRKV